MEKNGIPEGRSLLHECYIRSIAYLFVLESAGRCEFLQGPSRLVLNRKTEVTGKGKTAS